MELTLNQFTLKILRKVYQKLFGTSNRVDISDVEHDPDKASDIIYGLLSNDEPCMIARFGAFELSTIMNYLSMNAPKHSVWRYIKGEEFQWWWNKKLMFHMQNNAGFFPATKEKLSLFCEMMLKDARDVDVLGSWLKDENWVLRHNKRVKKVSFLCLEPYWSKLPWSRVLEGKRILVVHPFAEDIISQYNNHRELLFEDKGVLPKFASLRVVKAVQSLGGESNGFEDWFEALEWMKKEMDKEPYDIALIGCGAYGFPLAAHTKRTGHKAVHLGGALQLLFGIKGKRWDNIKYNPEYNYKDGLFNDFWIHPDSKTKPNNFQQVEGECYW